MKVYASNENDGDQMTFDSSDVEKIKEAMAEFINRADGLVPLAVARLTLWSFKSDWGMLGTAKIWYGRDVTDLIHSILDKVDFAELYYKMGKFMPSDDEVQHEFFEILDSDIAHEDKIAQLLEFFGIHADENIDNYMPNGGDIRGFAEYCINL